jgi:hypothetical protein
MTQRRCLRLAEPSQLVRGAAGARRGLCRLRRYLLRRYLRRHGEGKM